MKELNIFIGVAAHKNVIFPDVPFHFPICAGAYKNNINDLGKGYKDNTGINISTKNGIYNELTVQYWIWKNVDNVDYKGLSHYRRYFNFGKKLGKAPRLGARDIRNHNHDKKYGWRLKDIEEQLKGTDIIVPCRTARCIPMETIGDKFMTNGQPGTLYLAGDCISDICPEYKPYFDKMLRERKIHSFNMCIMRSDLYDAYSEWLFQIIELFERKYYEKYGLDIRRTCGEMAEYLLNVWLDYQMSENGLKVKELQTVMFYNTEINPSLKQSAKAWLNSVFTLIFPYGSTRREYIQYHYFFK